MNTGLEASTFNFCGYSWISQERWGIIHKDKPYVWYDKDSIIQKNNKELSLLSRYKPRFFEEIGRTAQMAVGLMSCTEEFSYGRFDLECKLPSLAYSWPAFWMYSWSDWPPEIDVFEGYSDKRARYDLPFWSKLLRNTFYKVESNVHVKGGKGSMWNLGPRRHYFGRKDPRNVFNKYSVIWLPNKIQFLYNDTVVRIVDDKETLSLINGHKMNVVINNSCFAYHKSHLFIIGEMIIKNFKYTSL